MQERVQVMATAGEAVSAAPPSMLSSSVAREAATGLERLGCVQAHVATGGRML